MNFISIDRSEQRFNRRFLLETKDVQAYKKKKKVNFVGVMGALKMAFKLKKKRKKKKYILRNLSTLKKLSTIDLSRKNAVD
jgi:hypothetical protein